MKTCAKAQPGRGGLAARVGAVGLALAGAASVAAAEPVRFNNFLSDPDRFTGKVIDITLPASQQPSEIEFSEATVGRFVGEFRIPGIIPGSSVRFFGVNDVAAFPEGLVGILDRALTPGEVIDDSEPFDGAISFTLETNQPTLLGVRLALSLDPLLLHFGWVEAIKLGPNASTPGVQFLAWGYETEPNTPMAAAVPAPGPALALLAGGAWALSRRRRR